MRIFLTCVAIALSTVPAQAVLQPEDLHVEKLSDAMQPHWVWANDISFDRMPDGRAYLLDGDTGQMLGMISGGYGHGSLMITPDGKRFAVPSTYHARGSRGVRTDVITFYKTTDLKPGAEPDIPAKRFNGIPFLAANPLSTDGKFGFIYNFTPEQSVTVINMDRESVVGEFATPGCALNYPTGPRSLFFICSDGALQPATLDDNGRLTLGTATGKLFAENDPVTEKGVWTGKEWLFFTSSGKVFVIDGSKPQPRIARNWSLTAKGEESWRPGGIQPATYHQTTGKLYVIMHQGGPETRKEPGKELWVFDAAKGVRLSKLQLDGMATAVAISQDDKPLIYTSLFGETVLKIYDASGKLLRKVDQLGPTMTVLQPAPVALRK